MITRDELCAAMAASGRHLTPRAARDWWTKGLLPRPRRHRAGRAKGTKTFWTEPRIIEQAQVAYDLLAAYPRADMAILVLWLLGFTMDLMKVRAAYRRSISDHFDSIRARNREQPDDTLGKLADAAARQCSIVVEFAPAEARNALTDLMLEFLKIFYSFEEEFAIEGLWKTLAPYLANRKSWSSVDADIHLVDDLLATAAQHFEKMGSLKAQEKAITSATDYELMRARRLVHLVFGWLGRLAQAAGCREQIEGLGSRLLIILGRPAVPILISVLRNNALRHRALSLILDLMCRLRQGLTDTRDARWAVPTVSVHA